MRHESGTSICSDNGIRIGHGLCVYGSAMEAKLKQEAASIVQALISFATLALVMTGVGGTIYKMISPGGWVTQAFGHDFSAGTAALGSLAIIAALAWFSRGWSSPGHRNRHAGLFVYAFAAAGLLYLARFWWKGTF